MRATCRHICSQVSSFMGRPPLLIMNGIPPSRRSSPSSSSSRSSTPSRLKAVRSILSPTEEHGWPKQVLKPGFLWMILLGEEPWWTVPQQDTGMGCPQSGQILQFWDLLKSTIKNLLWAPRNLWAPSDLWPRSDLWVQQSYAPRQDGWGVWTQSDPQPQLCQHISTSILVLTVLLFMSAGMQLL